MLALVVGNERYNRLQQLINPVNDGKAMAVKLRAKGARVFEGYDCTIEEMNEVKQKLLDAVRPGDIVIIFFAGHGVEYENANRLMAIGTSEKIDFRRDSWDLHVLLIHIKRKCASFALALLDCCRHFEYASGTRVRGGERPLHDFKSEMDSITAFACMPNHSALDGDVDGHGRSALDPTFLCMNEM